MILNSVFPKLGELLFPSLLSFESNVAYLNTFFRNSTKTVRPRM